MNLEEIKEKALNEHIPIIMDDTLEVIENIMKGCEPYVSDHFVDGRLYFWKFSHGGCFNLAPFPYESRRYRKRKSGDGQYHVPAWTGIRTFGLS